MTDSRPGVPLDRLLAHREWVRALARTLVRDENRADDVEQQTWLTALEHPPRHEASLRAWLAAVVRTAARKMARGDARRARHETTAASGGGRSRPDRPGAPVPGAAGDAADLVAEAELQHVLTRAVLDLEEPYRATVLLRWFDGLPPRAIAARTGVPVETVRTRLKRAHERLRERLDGTFDGDRRAWSLVVLAWPTPSATPPAPWPPFPVAEVLAMSALKKAAVAAVAVLLLAGAAWKVAGVVRDHGATSPTDDAATAPDDGPHEPARRAARTGTVSPAAPPDRDDPAQTGDVEVLVRDASGAPVAGVAVAAFPNVRSDPNALENAAAARIGIAPVPARSAVTGADGTLRLRGLPLDRSSTLVATKTGFARAGASATPGDDAPPRRVEILLVPAESLAGRVVTPGGTPVPGALVLAGGPSSRWAAHTNGAALLSRTTADPDGRFAFDALERGDVLVFAGRPGGAVANLATVRVPAGREVEIVLPDPYSVAGRVTDATSGAPIAGATVSAWCAVGFTSAAAVATTGADGRYRIDGLPFASAQIAAGAPGHVSQRANGARLRTLDASEVTVQDFALRRGATLTGTVRGGGAPVAGAEVTAAWADAYVRMLTATTGADGRYRIEGVPAGRVVVVVQADAWFQEGFPPLWTQAVQQGTAPAAATVEVAEGAEATRDIDLVRGLAVSGCVLGPDDAPVAGASVHLAFDEETAGGGPWNFATVKTVSDGTFRFTGVAPARSVSLGATHETLAPGEGVRVDLAPGVGAEGVVLRLVEPAIVRGHVTAPAGCDLSGTWVEWTTHAITGDPADDDWTWTSARRAPVGPDACFEVTTPTGTATFSVRAVAPGCPPSPAAQVSMTPAVRAHDVEVTVVRGRDVLGRVVDAETAAPLAGAHVRLAAVGGAPARTRGARFVYAPPEVATATTSGEFVLHGLADGVYEVTVDAAGHLPGKARFEVPTGDAVAVTLERERVLRGRVTLPDGAPAADVSVTVTGPGGMQQGPQGVTGIQSAATAADGSFEVAGLGAGPFTVSIGPRLPPSSAASSNVVAKTFQGVRESGDAVQFVVEPAAQIAGRVVDEAGAAVAGAWVQSVSDPKEGGAAGYGFAQVAQDGSFVLRGLRDGTHTLTAGGPQSAGSRAFTRCERKGVAAGATDVVLVLGEGLAIEGVVVDGEGRPVTGLTITATRLARLPDGSGWASTGSCPAALGPDGGFRIAGLAPGRHRLVLTSTDMRLPSALQFDPSAEAAAGATGLRLVATTATTISGRVTLGDDTDLSDVGVSAQRTNSADPPIGGQTDYAGRFVLVGAVPGATYDLRTSVLGLVQGRAKGVAAGTQDVHLRCEKGLSVRGRVTDADGCPAAGVLLWFFEESQDSSTSATTDAEGRFDAAGLLPGEHRVRFETFVLQQDGTRKREWRDCGVVRAGDDRAVLRVSEE